MVTSTGLYTMANLEREKSKNLQEPLSSLAAMLATMPTQYIGNSLSSDLVQGRFGLSLF
jgi:hypothetical protein